MLFFFFFNDTATTEIYTLSLHDALPIFTSTRPRRSGGSDSTSAAWRDRSLCSFTSKTKSGGVISAQRDRKSTRLNSSHANISYAVFCLKKKKKHTQSTITDPYTPLHSDK